MTQEMQPHPGSPENPWQNGAAGSVPAHGPSDEAWYGYPDQGRPADHQHFGSQPAGYPAAYGPPAHGRFPYGAPAHGGYAPGAPYPGAGYPAGPPYPFVPGPRRTNGRATTALVLAILGLCGIGSLLGIVLGNRAKAEIEQSGEDGRGVAQAAVIVGWITLAFTATMIVFYVMAFISANR